MERLDLACRMVVNAIMFTLIAFVLSCNDTKNVTNEQDSNLGWAHVLEQSPDPMVVTDDDLRDRIQATGHPWKVQEVNSGVTLVLIPPGRLIYGAPPWDPEASASERPQRELVISRSLYVSENEVALGQWVRIMGDDRLHPIGQESKPAAFVTWYGAMEFCENTGLRLLSATEWEYACRAGGLMPRYGELDDIAWHMGNSDEQPHAVGKKGPNDFGLHDMLGNVWEWCIDGVVRMGEDEWYSSDRTPEEVSEYMGRIMKGGSFESPRSECRASVQRLVRAKLKASWIGFRVARDP